MAQEIRDEHVDETKELKLHPISNMEGWYYYGKTPPTTFPPFFPTPLHLQQPPTSSEEALIESTQGGNLRSIVDNDNGDPVEPNKRRRLQNHLQRARLVDSDFDIDDDFDSTHSHKSLYSSTPMLAKTSERSEDTNFQFKKADIPNEVRAWVHERFAHSRKLAQKHAPRLEGQLIGSAKCRFDFFTDPYWKPFLEEFALVISAQTYPHPQKCIPLFPPGATSEEKNVFIHYYCKTHKVVEEYKCMAPRFIMLAAGIVVEDTMLLPFMCRDSETSHICGLDSCGEAFHMTPEDHDTNCSRDICHDAIRARRVPLPECNHKPPCFVSRESLPILPKGKYNSLIVRPFPGNKLDTTQVSSNYFQQLPEIKRIREEFQSHVPQNRYLGEKAFSDREIPDSEDDQSPEPATISETSEKSDNTRVKTMHSIFNAPPRQKRVPNAKSQLLRLPQDLLDEFYSSTASSLVAPERWSSGLLHQRSHFPYHCPEPACDEKFASPRPFNDHLTTHGYFKLDLTEFQGWSCSKCDYVGESYTKLAVHFNDAGHKSPSS